MVRHQQLGGGEGGGGGGGVMVRHHQFGGGGGRWSESISGKTTEGNLREEESKAKAALH